MFNPTQRKQVVDKLATVHRFEDLAYLTDQQIHELQLIANGEPNIYQHLESSVKHIAFKLKTLLGTDQKLRLSLDKQTCPTCEQNVRLRKEKLYQPMVEMLIRMRYMDKANPDEYIDVAKLCVEQKLKYQDITISKLANWGLVEAAKNTDKKKKNSGLWRITAKGIAFVEGKIEVEQYKYLYNGKIYPIPSSEVETFVTIRDCFGEHFDFDDFINNFE